MVRYLLLIAVVASCNSRSATSEQFVKDGRQYVRVRKYYDDGVLKTIATLREVGDTFLVDGIVEEFDQNGNTINIRSFVNGVMSGSAYYYKDGGAIEAYEFYDPEEKLFYKATFTGKKIEEEQGAVFPIIALHPYQPDDSVRIYAVNMPYRERNLIIRNRVNSKDTILYISKWKADFIDLHKEIIYDTVAISLEYISDSGNLLSDSLMLP